MVLSPKRIILGMSRMFYLILLAVVHFKVFFKNIKEKYLIIEINGEKNQIILHHLCFTIYLFLSLLIYWFVIYYMHLLGGF